MKWSIQELRVKASEPMSIQTTVDFKDALKERDDEILDISPISVHGILLYENHTVLCQLDVEADVTVPSTRSLDPVDLHLSFPIRERYIEEGWETDIVDEDDTLQLQLESDTVDIDKAIQDNLILNIPSKRLTDEEANGKELPSGEGWQLLTEETMEDGEEKKSEETVDPRMAPLKELLKNQDQSEKG